MPEFPVSEFYIFLKPKCPRTYIASEDFTFSYEWETPLLLALILKKAGKNTPVLVLLHWSISEKQTQSFPVSQWEPFSQWLLVYKGSQLIWVNLLCMFFTQVLEICNFVFKMPALKQLTNNVLIYNISGSISSVHVCVCNIPMLCV